MATGRPISEIEITPEMIEAGIAASLLFKLSEDELSLVLSEIYRAMAAASSAREHIVA